MKNKLYTHQYFTSRIITGKVEGEVSNAVTDFLAKCKEDHGEKSVSIHIDVSGNDGEYKCWLSLEDFPEGEAFGDWFDKWAEDHDVEVYD